MRYLITCSFLIWMSCQSASTSQRPLPIQDTSINPQNAFSTLFLPHDDLQAFVDSAQFDDSMTFIMEAFYRDRNFQFAWFHPKGPFQHTQSFLHTLEDVFYT